MNHYKPTYFCHEFSRPKSGNRSRLDGCSQGSAATDTTGALAFRWGVRFTNKKWDTKWGQQYKWGQSIAGWWLVYPSEKYESIGMIRHPILMGKWKMATKPPTRYKWDNLSGLSQYKLVITSKSQHEIPVNNSY